AMLNQSNQFLLLIAGALLASCGSVPTRTFKVRAINIDQQPVPCIVVIGDDWSGAADKRQFLNADTTTLNLPVQFKFPAVTLTAAAMEFDAEGKPLNNLSTRSAAIEVSDYLTDVREEVRFTDPEVILFVLRKK
ncbi:MAG: hypothetical protein ABIP94_02175, partial [Planctomycetota bacterium]